MIKLIERTDKFSVISNISNLYIDIWNCLDIDIRLKILKWKLL